jgi:hypothetical protein
LFFKTKKHVPSVAVDAGFGFSLMLSEKPAYLVKDQGKQASIHVGIVRRVFNCGKHMHTGSCNYVLL